MPKLVNYSARFEFLREAAFTVVHDDGVAALSRHSVARALGTSVNTVRRLLAADAELVVLAADEVARRRSYGRFGRLWDGEPLDRALHVVRALLPDVEHRVAEELVWLRLALARPQVTSSAAGAEGTPLRERWQIAEHGWVEHGWADTGQAAPDARTGTTGSEVGTDADDPLAEHAQRRQEEVDHRIAEALEVLAIPLPARKAEAELLGAVALGLSWAVCGGRLTPSEAVTYLEQHLATLETQHRQTGAAAS